MTIREIYRDDLLNRFPGHSFVETVVGSTTLVELQDGVPATIAQAVSIDVSDAYALIRGNIVGTTEILPILTQAQRDALTATIEGTPILNVDSTAIERFEGGAWVPTNQILEGNFTFLGSTKFGGETSVAPNGALDVVGTSAATARIRTVRYQSLANGAAAVQIGHSRGTEASPLALLSGDRIGQLIWVGGNGVTAHGPGPVIRAVTTEDWGAAAKGSRLTVETIPNGETSEALAFTISEHGYPEAPTYTAGTLPPVGDGGGEIFVSDETGGATMAFSDGTNWRRVHDRAIVS